MRQKSTMFRGDRMTFTPISRLGAAQAPLGQTYQEQTVENARFRLAAAEADYDAAKRAYQSDPSDQNFAAMSAAADRVTLARSQMEGAKYATMIFVQTKSGNGLPLMDVKVSAFGEDGTDYVVKGAPRVTGPGGRLELLLDSMAIGDARTVIVRPAAGDWTPDQKVFDVSEIANQEVTFTKGQPQAGPAPAVKGAYSPFLMIGALAVVAAIVYLSRNE